MDKEAVFDRLQGARDFNLNIVNPNVMKHCCRVRDVSSPQEYKWWWETKLSRCCVFLKSISQLPPYQLFLFSPHPSLKITARPHPRTCNDHKASVPQDTIWTRNQGMSRNMFSYIFFLRKINDLNDCIPQTWAMTSFQSHKIMFLIPKCKSLRRGYCNHWNT